MTTFVPANSVKQNRFQPIGDFKWYMKRNDEVQFDWKNLSFCRFWLCFSRARQPSRMVIVRLVQ